MNKHLLLRRISKIHSAKCNKSVTFDEAVASFDELNKLKGLVIEAEENQMVEIIIQIQNWAGTSPAVNFE